MDGHIPTLINRALNMFSRFVFSGLDDLITFGRRHLIRGRAEKGVKVSPASDPPLSLRTRGREGLLRIDPIKGKNPNFI